MALLGDDLEHDAAVVLPSFFEVSPLAMSKDSSDDQKQRKRRLFFCALGDKNDSIRAT